ncbi:cysteate synthase [Methanohalophilus levihalophilus]|uniref:cysteate synthase n=1 Tax=Methanohalophilus levihalophilus TaxID=1431282 RepID=UPI001AE8847C|nr:cysteate synthase [Methanohalophilus levihalophilus]MBP2030780.1 cysteate synthase [Methanohalophilus levihalophilus]
MDKYSLRCPICGKVYGKYNMTCPADGALLRTEYSDRQLKTLDLPGIWKYYNWLPVNGTILEGSGRTVTYRSEELARELGLEKLYISFNGYWPEKEAFIRTCSFKDLESYPTMQRLKEQHSDATMVVASAGNTARAFAHVASLTDTPLLLVVPESAKERLWIPAESTESISVAAVDGDYYDAIEISSQITEKDGFVAEGGAKNVARRDGMGTVLLDATLTMKHLPDHYFQAVGSGTGGIAVWEAAMRLIGDGRFGDRLPKLHLAQNIPCAPLLNLHDGTPIDITCPDQMWDDVLFNRKPPYTVGGGVKDALDDTNGELYGISNAEAEEAKKLFEELEGIDVLNASSVAVAALIKAVHVGKINPDELVMLNITGGGVKRAMEELPITSLDIDITVSPDKNDSVQKILDVTSEKIL